ncbi:MAG: GIY-YIG nuclease family protein [Xanthobacteraceae bacterium]|nr:GIY-YIG nuclease family protein [Xanthobacteraceae bacterium]MBX3549994.1 GIY-YIG nuclease family protein [Xanthobacteraceae bacterium]MCW5674246.1 GIY-YIG nuclease family protein [Xanthobacteraceae bacterium]
MSLRFFVYILATRKDGPIYVGITNNLQKRVFEHKSRSVAGFTKRYNVDRLVWFEEHSTANAAITKEKQLKRWRRIWKKELIERFNPEWDDLYSSLDPE